MKYSGARLLAMAAALASGAVLATVVAYWGTRALAPAPVHIPPAAPADPVAAILASGLMRAPAAAAAPQAEAKKDETLSGDARLLGVFAERDGRGYALFRLPTGPKLVAQGQDIAQGAKLVAVRPDGITIRDAGGERGVALRGEPPPKPAPANATVAAKSARNPACMPPPGFKGTVLRLNAELFQGIVNKPETWTAMVTPDQGALAVRDDSGFVTMLAMKKGDRLLQANGIPLSAPEDVVGAVLRPLASAQSVRVTGTRDGQPREWLLLNAGTCPG
ncbi:MAG: type II secretion system protein N [Burkholderiales bacterium]